MILAISGTPGCGKTTIAKQLSKLVSFTHIELTEFIKEYSIAEKFDENMQSLVVDVSKLDDALTKKLDKSNDYLIDGHMAHDLSFIDGAIICTCELKELKERLEKRGYSSEKVRENLDAEIFDTCYVESVENDIPTVKLHCTDEVSDAKLLEVFETLVKERK